MQNRGKKFPFNRQVLDFIGNTEDCALTAPRHIFGQLTEKRWNIVRFTQGNGEPSVRALAWGVDRDVKRVHEDVGVLSQLGLLECTASGGDVCPFVEMHIDMCLKAA